MSLALLPGNLKVQTAVVAAALVALSTGAMAAPIAVNPPIDSSQVIVFPASYEGDWPETILLPGLNDALSQLAPEYYWKSALIFPGAPLGQQPGEGDAQTASGARQNPVPVPEPPAVLISGFGFGAMILWHRREKIRTRRRRRLLFRLRAMARLF